MKTKFNSEMRKMLDAGHNEILSMLADSSCFTKTQFIVVNTLCLTLLLALPWRDGFVHTIFDLKESEV